MATIAAPIMPSAEQRERLLFLVFSCAISALAVSGFAINLAMGRAVPSPPLIFHLHALAFLAWLAIHLAQSWFAWRGDLRWHRQLGIAALGFLPVLVVLAMALTVTSLRLHGGPPILGVSEFLFVNAMHIAAFAALTGVAIGMWRRNDWHRRLMLVGLASIASPGIARLLPLPLLVPYAFPVLITVAMAIPALAMLIDTKRTGRIHPAWLWGIASVYAALFIGQAMAASDWGTQFAQELIAGTPGAERPMEAFVPPM